MNCTRAAAALAWVVFLALTASAQARESLSIHWLRDSASQKNVRVEVRGLDSALLEKLEAANWTVPEWQQVFTVRVSQPLALDEIGLPPMLGRYSVGAGKIVFEPQFPLDTGMKYRATFLPAHIPGGAIGAKTISALYELPPISSAKTTVAQIYPTTDSLPENLLKFYIHFSGPMSGGHIYDHIRLLDETGKPVELPFLEIDEELWNREMTRLTLFLDPGRIKRGVKPLEEVGPSLREGGRYTLVIEPSWKDANGQSLAKAFEKKFHVIPPDRRAIDPSRWKVQAPMSSTRHPLVISFEKPLDHALALRMIRILDPSGKQIQGQSETRSQESELAFRPLLDWRPGSYNLSVETTIEDLSGNNIGKPFEVDLFEGTKSRLTSDTIHLPFQIR